MSSVSSHSITNPYGKEDKCAKFVITDISEKFVLSDTVSPDQKYTFSFWVRSEKAGNVVFDFTDCKTSTTWHKYALTFAPNTEHALLRFSIAGTYYIYHPKLELGDKATDWTPAPEDMASVDDINGVLDWIETYQTRIEQTEKDIILTATRIEAMGVGNRNLILDSRSTVHTRTNTTAAWLRESDGSLYLWRNTEYCASVLAGGGDFTLSFDYNITGITSACDMRICLRSRNESYHSTIGKDLPLVVGNNEGHYSYTFTPTDGMRQYGTQWLLSNIGVGKNADAVFTFTNIKFEKGNEATGWTPAPEDVENRLGKAETQIKQNADAIELRATKDELESRIKQTAEGITSTVVQKIDIGGRNLILDSSSRTHTRTNASNSHLADDDGSLFRWANSPYGVSALADGGEFTISFDYEITGITSACNAAVGLRQSGAGTYGAIAERIALTTGNNSGHYSCTFTPTAAMMQYGTYWTILSVGANKNADAVFTFTNIKFEKGNKATDWTPAPEDVDDNIANIRDITDDHSGRLTSAESEIEQLADKIVTRVTDGDGTTRLVQTGDGWSFDISGLEGSVGQVLGDTEALRQELEGTQSDLSGLSSDVSDISAKTAFVHIGNYNGNPCIELGKNDDANGFKLRITNEAIQFIHGNDIPAYITNQKLMIEQAEVVNDLQFGGFVWAARDNKNMGILWRGVDS